MKELHIKGLSINWDKIAPDSYLRGIESIAGISKEMVCICLTSLRLRYLRNAN